jgi:hypothetical protein
MKKMLIMAVIVIGGGTFLKHNLVVTPNGQVTVAGWNVPVPAAVQSSPLYSMVMMVASMQAAGQPAAGDPRHGAGQPARPAMPNVTSAASTYNPNPQPAASGGTSDQFNAVTRALHGQ